MSKIDIAVQMLREGFTEALREAFAERFDGLRIGTYWSPLAGIAGGYVSCLEDSEDAFNVEQVAFLAGFEAAWLKASAIVQEER